MRFEFSPPVSARQRHCFVGGLLSCQRITQALPSWGFLLLAQPFLVIGEWWRYESFYERVPQRGALGHSRNLTRARTFATCL